MTFAGRVLYFEYFTKSDPFFLILAFKYTIEIEHIFRN